MIYYLMLIVVVFAGIFSEKFKRGRKIYCFFAGLLFFLAAAIRKGTGYDYNLYAKFYRDLNFATTEDISYIRNEKGFMMPMKIFSEVFADHQFFFIIIALAVAVGISVYIYKHSQKPWISFSAFMIFGIYFNSMNFMRQILAAIIIMYAIEYIKSNQFLRYLALVLFASTLHVSALIMLPFYFILKIRINKISLPIYTAVSILLFTFSEPILRFITQYIYKGYSLDSSVEITNGLPITYFVVFILFFIIVFILQNRIEKHFPQTSLLVSSMFFAVLFEFYGIKHGIVSRFALHFFIAPILLLSPYIFIAIKELVMEKAKLTTEKKRIAVIGAYALICVLSIGVFQNFLNNNYNGVLPYRTIFEKKEAAQIAQ